LRSQKPEEYELYALARHSVDTLVAVREQADFNYAEQRLKQALLSNPDYNDARILLAHLYYQDIWDSPQRDKLLENSRLLLETAIQKEPQRAEANALLAGVYAEQGQRERGMELVQRALRFGPLNSTAYRELAKLYAEAGFFESAVVEDDRSLALDPANLSALSSKIFVLSWMGRRSEADLALKKVQEWQPTGLSDWLRTDRELRTGNFAAASHLLRPSPARTNNSVNTQANEIARALKAALTGNINEAKKLFEKYPDHPPRFFDHYILLAAQIGDVRRAVDYIRKNPLYYNYRYLVTESRLAPLRAEPGFQALLRDAYSKWQADLVTFGPSLPASPPLLPNPQEFLALPRLALVPSP
jgi:Tfp pilus assembly protein PilF